jgi:hypothetical protein
MAIARLTVWNLHYSGSYRPTIARLKCVVTLPELLVALARIQPRAFERNGTYDGPAFGPMAYSRLCD